MPPLRLGILGAATRIAPQAVIRPAAQNPDVVVIVAVAARDRARAEAFAREHAIPRVHGSYEELIEDPEVDAVYNPLPNGYHAEYTILALERGKHVLCEKPLACNAGEAAAVEAARARTGRSAVCASHWSYHPQLQQMRDFVRADHGLGRVTRWSATFIVPRGAMPLDDVRYDLRIGGGALMDLGHYAVDAVRKYAGMEPEVVSAVCREPAHLPAGSRIDQRMTAELAFPDGSTGAVDCDMCAPGKFSMSLTVTYERGSAKVAGYLSPGSKATVFDAAGAPLRSLRSDAPSGTFRGVHGSGPRDAATGRRQVATYDLMLASFAAEARGGARCHTTVSDAVLNMRVIDACYEAAGIGRRPSRLLGEVPGAARRATGKL